MEQIKIGRNSFNTDTLKGLTLEQAKTLFKHVNERIVTQAHEMANPEPKAKAKPKRKRKKE